MGSEMCIRDRLNARPVQWRFVFASSGFQTQGISVSVELWQQCVELLRDELPAQQFNTWIRPLQVEAEGDELRVYAPNRFVLDWVNEKYMGRMLELLGERATGLVPAISLLIGSRRSSAPRAVLTPSPSASSYNSPAPAAPAPAAPAPQVSAPPAKPPAQTEPSRASFDSMAGASSSVAPARSERNVQVEGGLKHTSYLNRTCLLYTSPSPRDS